MKYAETVLKSSKKIQLNLGGSDSMQSWGCVWCPTLLEKTLENRYKVEMHVHSLKFQGQLTVKKLDR